METLVRVARKFHFIYIDFVHTGQKRSFLFTPPDGKVTSFLAVIS